MKLDKNKKIALGIAALGIIGYILFKKGVFGGSEGGNGGSGESANQSVPSLPIVDVSSGSETPQVAVVNIPPQFGAETAIVNRLPEGAFQVFN